MPARRFRHTELDAAQGYARRLRSKLLGGPVRVIRRRGEIVVAEVADERRVSVPHAPDRRSAGE